MMEDGCSRGLGERRALRVPTGDTVAMSILICVELCTCTSEHRRRSVADPCSTSSTRATMAISPPVAASPAACGIALRMARGTPAAAGEAPCACTVSCACKPASSCEAPTPLKLFRRRVPAQPLFETSSVGDLVSGEISPETNQRALPLLGDLGARGECSPRVPSGGADALGMSCSGTIEAPTLETATGCDVWYCSIPTEIQCSRVCTGSVAQSDTSSSWFAGRILAVGPCTFCPAFAYRSSVPVSLRRA